MDSRSAGSERRYYKRNRSRSRSRSRDLRRRRSRSKSRYRRRTSRKYSSRRDDSRSYDRYRSDERRYSTTRRRYESRSREKRSEKKRLKKKKKRRDDSGGYDDTVGAYEGKVGDVIAGRYKILGEAGVGTFGRVLECTDQKTSQIVAIKVVRSIQKYTDSATIEARILEEVNRRDEGSDSLCVQLYKRFIHEGHMCLVFEKLGCSLYDYLKNHDYHPFPFPAVRHFAYQLLKSLKFLHDMDLIHTDLKPENILFIDDSVGQDRCSSSSDSKSNSSSSSNEEKKAKLFTSNSAVDESSKRFRLCIPPSCTSIKLIDFGGATYDDETKSSIISTRQYRAPEVMLGLRWGAASDIWSAGCILGELYIGDLFFCTHENLEHFAMIDKCVGPFPGPLVQMGMGKKSSDLRKYFSSNYKLRWPEKASSSSSRRRVEKMPLIDEAIERGEDVDGAFLDLMKRMLVIDPAQRITANDALKHRFFSSLKS